MSPRAAADDAAWSDYQAARDAKLVGEFRVLARDARVQQWSDSEMLRYLDSHRGALARAAFASPRHATRLLLLETLACAAHLCQRSVTRRDTMAEDYADLRETLRLQVRKSGRPGARKTADFLRAALSVVNMKRRRGGDDPIKLRTARRVWDRMKLAS